jgi:hypothetical protein
MTTIVKRVLLSASCVAWIVPVSCPAAGGVFPTMGIARPFRPGGNDANPALRIGPASSPSPATGSATRYSSGIPTPGGGAIIAAVDAMPDGTPRICVQRLDTAGAAQWGAGGVLVATTDGDQATARVTPGANGLIDAWTGPAVVSDGAGGAIVVWADTRVAGPGLYAQRLDATGARQWGDGGVALALADPAPGPPQAVSDGAGGVIVTWEDRRDGVQSDIYARRVDASGTPLWTNDGVKVYSNGLDQIHPTIVADGAGGAVIAWEDQRSGISSDVYAQRLNGAGARQWGNAGLAVSNGAGEQLFPAIAASDTFFVLVWQDTRDGTGYSLYSQRLSRFGVASWTAGGVPECLTPGVRGVPVIAGDGAGGATIAWSEERMSPYFADVFAQKIGADGTPQWAADGVAVFTSVLYMYPSVGEAPVPVIATDGAGGLYAAYAQLDQNHIFELDVTLQHLDAGGVPLTGNGVLMTHAPLDQFDPAMIPDGAGGCVVWWSDIRAEDLDVYAQHRDAGGSLLWSPDGAPVHLSPGGQRLQSLVEDGSGGVIVGYAQKMGANYDVFARRFDAVGTPLWSVRTVCDAPGLQGAPALLADGAGGAYFLWIDLRVNNAALYVQHLDGSGSARWALNGVPVKTTTDWLEAVMMIPDGAGGVIIPFRQLQDIPAGNYDLWAQRFSPDGTRRWGNDGVPVSRLSGDVPWYPVGVPDGAGGVILAWEDWYPGDRMLAQRLDSTGTSQWLLDGLPIEGTHQSLTLPSIASDGAGGAILAWQDSRAGSLEAPDLYGQRLGPTGSSLWGASGAVISSGPGAQTDQKLVADGSGGVFVIWADDRGGAGFDVVAQRLSSAGAPMWTGGPHTLSAQTGAQELPVAIADDTGGFIAAWQDARSGADQTDVFAQRMDAAGLAAWTTDGVPVCDAPGPQGFPNVAGDGASGVFVGWSDARDGGSLQIYLQHLAANGDTLFVKNGITGVTAALVTAVATVTKVDLVWQVKGGGTLDLERRSADTPWRPLGRVDTDGTGLVRYTDTQVTPGRRYGYRLVWSESGTRRASGETWVDVPGVATLALSAPEPNPTHGVFGVELTLPRAGPATLEVLDVGGRRVALRTVNAAAPGVQRVTWVPDRRLAAGLYVIRLEQAGITVTRKACVLP